MRVLLIEDNVKFAKAMKEKCERECFAVDMAHDAHMGTKLLRLNPYDIAVVDYMLPGGDGVTLVKQAREANIMIPIILATARDTTEDKIAGLDSGADDYIVKPFELSELLARMRALLRRPKVTVQTILKMGAVTLNPTAHTVMRGDEPIDLTTKEFMMLEYLMSHEGKTVTRVELLEHCWDFAFDSTSNIVDVYIKQLRAKLDTHDTHYIQTIRGVGYQAHPRHV